MIRVHPGPNANMSGLCLKNTPLRSMSVYIVELRNLTKIKYISKTDKWLMRKNGKMIEISREEAMSYSCGLAITYCNDDNYVLEMEVNEKETT